MRQVSHTALPHASKRLVLHTLACAVAALEQRVRAFKPILTRACVAASCNDVRTVLQQFKLMAPTVSVQRAETPCPAVSLMTVITRFTPAFRLGQGWAPKGEQS